MERTVIFALLAAAFGCQERTEPVPPKEGSRRQIDELRALGYLAFTEDAPTKTGVLRTNPERVQPGYTLYATRVRCRAALIDSKGETVHTWHLAECRGWDHVELLDNGALLAAAKARPRGQLLGRHANHDRFLVELGRDSEVIWRRDLWAHHDAVPTGDGRIVALTSEMRLLPRVHRRVPVRDDHITFLDGGSISIYDVLATNDLGFTMQKVAVSRERTGAVIDLLHTNSIAWLDGERVLVCMRHQDAIALIDVADEKLAWIWGQGQLSGPHDATPLAGGTILLYDNGLARKRSRVVEVNPTTNEIVWQYGWGENDLEFFTRSHGSAQRLDNGNTLIGVSDAARAVEVTPKGEVVWEFISPKRKDDNKHATINRVRRYPTRRVDAWLKRDRLVPGTPKH